MLAPLPNFTYFGIFASMLNAVNWEGSVTLYGIAVSV